MYILAANKWKIFKCNCNNMWHNFNSNNESPCSQPCRSNLASVIQDYSGEPQTLGNISHSNSSLQHGMFPRAALALLVSCLIRKYMWWRNKSFQIFHLSIFLNVHIPGLFHNRLLLLASLVLSPNREDSTESSGYFSAFCQALVSF